MHASAKNDREGTTAGQRMSSPLGLPLRFSFIPNRTGWSIDIKKDGQSVLDVRKTTVPYGTLHFLSDNSSKVRTTLPPSTSFSHFPVPSTLLVDGESGQAATEGKPRTSNRPPRCKTICLGDDSSLGPTQVPNGCSSALQLPQAAKAIALTMMSDNFALAVQAFKWTSSSRIWSVEN